ncbi:MAG: YigZ family protein [Bacteriovoracaceae bacterium]|nr:IMPACT family protein [Bacteroidota bacterium]
MDEIYRSIATATSVQIKVEGSRFIADVMPSVSEEEARTRLEAVRKQYFDATHHCFAYIIGAERTISRYSDDGEPSGTAGVKIHAAIHAKGLSDTLVIVTRYFGGTKLGVGGLGRAYFESAEHGIALAPTIQKAMVQELRVTFPFSETNPIMNIITSQKLKIAATEYTHEHTNITLYVLPSLLNSVSVLFTNATRGAAGLERGAVRSVVWK